ncbi:hypothetical protein DEA8626_03329 [Defluviimonas aquaemixtae]|uniref:DUF403 domain-containing protein n=1 Tax=Albidovulum aquaemixtae TaxID=1542388 RepID=A0A2R8BLH4_9RHOB|nr:alpha-E domain-containing protein [Defluviimonas aquaemixtae]SPH24279.1 hypothetical protein DEA8626_03329 [Defluviimonas aquaemixtae]
MLGRTANGLFWMYRYLERAENTSRLIETGQRIALTRLRTSDEEWRSVMQTAAVCDGYDLTHDEVTKDSAIDWMLRSKENTSSVMSAITAARQNARSVRTALTSELWEAMNAAYMTTSRRLSRKVPERDLPDLLKALRHSTALVRGMTHGTMLRNDIYDFSRIGTFLERADNTARILDVKYYVLLPSLSAVGSSIDNVQWETILRSVSGRGGFRMTYGSMPQARDVACYLILDGRMPRSIAFSTGKIRDNLEYLSIDYGIQPPSLELARGLSDACASTSIEEIFHTGLHEYLQTTLFRLSALGKQIERDFRFYN